MHDLSLALARTRPSRPAGLAWLLAALWALALMAAHADAPAINFPTAGATYSQPATLGYVITANTDTSVVALGYFDNATPLTDTHQVGLFDTDGTLLVTAMVGPITAGSTQEGLFAYTALPQPFPLKAGHQYVVAAQTNGGQFTFAVPNTVVDSRIGFVGNVGVGGSTFTFPGTQLHDPNGGFSYFGPGLKLATAPTPPARSPFVKILALGDSLTYGHSLVHGFDNSPNGGYRRPLQELLNAAGTPAEFVGGRTANSIGMINPEHEGYPGFRIANVQVLAADRVAAYQPDIVLLEIGGNDLLFPDQNNPPFPVTAQRLDQIITTITAAKPGVTVLVGNLPHLNPGPYTTAASEEEATPYNDAVPVVVQKHQALGEKVYFVDVHSYVTAADQDQDGVHPNDTGYFHMARAWDSVLSTLALPRFAPVAPSHLTATAGTSQATLSWTTGLGSVTYSVYRGTVAGGEAPTPVATGLTAPTFTDTGLADGAAYYYRVTATDGAGESARSNEAVAALPPLPPTGLTAAGGAGRVALSWAASAGAARYSVYRGTAAGGEAAKPIATGLTDTTYTDTGLGSAVTYYYRVTASNDSGESAPSAEASATTAPDLAVSGLTASDASPGTGDSVVLTATVTNNDAAGTVGSEAVTFYDGDPQSGGTRIGAATAGPLSAGQSAAVSVTWTAQGAAKHTLYAVAAPLAGEVNTANNTTSATETVYTYYTYSTVAKESGTGTSGTTSVSKVYTYSVSVPMGVIKEIRVVTNVSAYSAAGSQAAGQPGPSLESDTSSGRTDLALIGTVTPTGTGSWVMSSQSAAVTGTIRPLANNYLDLKINGLNAAGTAKDQVSLSGLTIQIKYLAP